jgi:hypothetical protein
MELHLSAVQRQRGRGFVVEGFSLDLRPMVSTENDWRGQRQMKEPIKITIDHVYPPIPIRKTDWRATIEGREEVSHCSAYGETAVEALRNLAEQMEGNEDD